MRVLSVCTLLTVTLEDRGIDHATFKEQSLPQKLEKARIFTRSKLHYLEYPIIAMTIPVLQCVA